MIMCFGGCAASRLEKGYGSSYKLAISGQTLNPEAGKDLEPVYGLDGQAAYRSVIRWRKSFDKIQPPAFYTTGISAIPVVTR
ncbi:MAG: hypothetical protein E3K32_13485 [wastewater metagenome]|nr:hypothetical protein [Candidatus Loosdrechtia aerotolerans]